MGLSEGVTGAYAGAIGVHAYAYHMLAEGSMKAEDNNDTEGLRGKGL